MRKRAMCALLAALLLAPSVGVLAGDGEETPPFLIGETLYGSVLPISFPAKGEAEGDYPDEPERVIFVEDPGSPGFWLHIPPDGPDGAAYHDKAVSYRMEWDYYIEDSIIIQPTALTIIGEVLREAKVVAYDSTKSIEVLAQNGDEYALQITPDTYLHMMATCVPGDTVEVLYDPETLAAFQVRKFMM